MDGTRACPAKDIQTQESPVAQVERLIGDMLDDGAATPSFFPQSMKQFRRALAAVGRDDTMELLDLAFRRTITAGVEILVRSLLALRGAIDSHDAYNRKGGSSFPDIQKQAERTERIVSFLLGAARDFSRVKHVAVLARRADDPKIVDLQKASRAAKSSKRRDKGRSRRRAAGKNA